jgi:EAL domain-containing protein (putative c-di-GMP-specific phosphodiesterase class I)
MFDRARTACSMARNNYQKRLIVYDNEMRSKELYEQRLLNDLHRALNSYEFEVHYQPQYDIQCDPPKFVGAEALVRWNHPDLGMIPPGDFIGLFERNGKIGEVDQFVWAEAARKVARWRDIYGITVPVSVNLSRADVFDPALESALDRLMAYNGLSQGSLRMEVTESAYTENADQVVRVVEGLRQKGYIVEMDDFGSGYSSLNMLSAMPVDVLKMDRAFIRRISESEKDRHLVALILGIAKNMKIPVVAEGVETEEQLRVLTEMGCNHFQGYFFCRPLPAEAFEKR